MGRTLKRTVILLDQTTGEYVTMLPGESVPDHLQEFVTNPAAYEDPDEEVEDFLTGGYRSMKVADLLTMAQNREVDLMGATRKEEIIQRLEAADAAADR